MRSTRTARIRTIGAGIAAMTAIALLAGCTAGSPEGEEDVADQGTTSEENEATGDTVTIGFSGPAADHGWLGAINSGAIEAGRELPRRGAVTR